LTLHIYFDLDGTLVDEEGDSLRPGIRELLDALCTDGIVLSLWTASSEERAIELLARFQLTAYFSNVIAREHYDPNGEGLGKDIRYLDGDVLVDDDPKHIAYVRSIGKQGLLVASYARDRRPAESELDELWRSIGAIAVGKGLPHPGQGVSLP